MDRDGRVKHVDWSREFIALRRAVGMTGRVEDGYMIHEAVQWSDVHQRWFFLPRKVSYGPYDKKLDPELCGNILLTADEHFKDIQVIQINSDNRPLREQRSDRGFSSLQFVPGTWCDGKLEISAIQKIWSCRKFF